MKRLSEDPFTDGSYAREWSPRMVWDAVHGETPTQEHREILDWWKDKPHQVLCEACEGWRQSESALAELEREMCKLTEERDAEIKRARIAEAKVERLRRMSEAANKRVLELEDGIDGAARGVEPLIARLSRALERADQAESALAERERECDRLRGELAGSDVNVRELWARAEAAESALAAARDDHRTWPTATSGCQAEPHMVSESELAALRSRADDAGRVERVAKELPRILEREGMRTDGLKDTHVRITRAVLAAADRMEP